jgi:hypothetical protein
VNLDREGVIQQGTHAHTLISQPGFKDLLDDLEKIANAKLTELKGARYAAAEVIKGLLQEWLRWEEMLHQVQARPYSKIDAAKQLVESEQAEKEALLLRRTE